MRKPMKISEHEQVKNAWPRMESVAASSAPPAGSRSGITALPDLGRSDATVVMISEWAVGTEQRQSAAVNAIADAWRGAPQAFAPLSYSVFPSIDGDTLLHYSQWVSEDAFHDFVQSQRQSRIDKIDAAVPGIERYGLGSYQLYRSHLPVEPVPAAGCMVAIRVEADGPERQRQWVDAVIEALQGDHVPGLVAAHFHICSDGRIVNYALWESAQAHQNAIESGAPGIAQIDSPAWQRVRTMPGITQMGFKRYALPTCIADSPPDTASVSGQLHTGGRHA